MIRGLDVSYAQGHIPASDWAQLATNGCKFAFVKVAEGIGQSPDVRCAEHVQNARAAGLVVGGYFFVHFGAGIDPEAQAELHHKLALDEGLNQPGDLCPAMDLEWPDPKDWAKHGCTPDQIRRDALAYLNTSAELWGVAPAVYSYLDYWMHLGGSAEPRFAGYPLWIAYYNSVTERAWPTPDMKPILPRPWTQWTFWQCSGGSMKLPSGTPCDFDVFNGDDLSAVCQTPNFVSETSDPVASGTDPKGGLSGT